VESGFTNRFTFFFQVEETLNINVHSYACTAYQFQWVQGQKKADWFY
jgi:hypothetical protein